MGLSGNLRTMDLPEILQWASRGRKTGTLRIERRSIQKQVMFQEGDIYSSTSNDPREYLGQYLIREQLLSEEQLFRVLLRQEAENLPLGVLLVEDRLLGQDALRRLLQTKAEESIYDLFLWPDGAFEFHEGNIPASLTVHLDLSVTDVVLEGIRRVDEWNRIRAVFPSARTTFQATGVPLGESAEKRALELAASGKTLAEISLELRRSEFDAATLLFELHQKGVLSVLDPGEEKRQADPVGAIKDLLSMATKRLEERRYDAAWELYEEVLALDRLNQHAKKGQLALHAARRKERAFRAVPLYKVPAVCVDFATLTRESFDPQEGFVLSRVNGSWDVQSILKLCPIAEEDALLIFARLLERGVIELKDPEHRRLGG
jgi:hypothetical protein